MRPKSAPYGRCTSCGDPLYKSEASVGTRCNVCIKWGSFSWLKKHRNQGGKK